MVSHSAIEFDSQTFTPEEAVQGGLTAKEDAPAAGPYPADGNRIVYKKQPSLDELQHVAKQLLPPPASDTFEDAATGLLGSSYRPTTGKGKSKGATPAAVWAGNVRRLARELARSTKATARAAGKHAVRTGGKSTCSTHGRKGPGKDDDPLHDLVGSHTMQQAPAIGVMINPPGTTVKNFSYFAPAHCAVFRSGDNCYVNLNGITRPGDETLIGFTAADGFEADDAKVHSALRHVSIVSTGLVTLMCSPARARGFKYGDTVYIDGDKTVALRRRPKDSAVAMFTWDSRQGPKVGRFIEACGPRGGIRVQLEIENV